MKLVRGLIMLVSLTFVTLVSFSQEVQKFDINVGFHPVFVNLAPFRPFNPRILPSTGAVIHLQGNKTYYESSPENPLFKLKYGLSTFIRLDEFSLPIFSATNTIQFNLLRKKPDNLTIGLENHLQFGKLLIRKDVGDNTYTTMYFSFYAAFRPNKHFKRLRIRYRYDITPFSYYYFEPQDVNTTFTYQRGFSLEYTFKTKKQKAL